MRIPTYLRRERTGARVFASSLKRLLDLLLLLVEHDHASLLGAAFRKVELSPWDWTGSCDDLEDEAEL